MVVADTSVWIDHPTSTAESLQALLNAGRILMHPFVVGEIAVGSLRQRLTILAFLGALPRVDIVPDDDVIAMIERERLFSIGIGYIDCHLLASVSGRPGTSFWTRDKRLRLAADRLGLSASTPTLH
ncbi:MAG: type II toxin-antitoxin system VapC family toxin [Rhizobiaceae bacterium]|nr:type II toxin-antitoxin system VapC family toxin [Rhizobiaceae bacterium]